MSLGWRFMLPLALAYIVIIATAVLILDSAGIHRGAMYSSILGALNMALVVIVFAILDRGRIISPAYARSRADELARLRSVSARSPLAPGVTD